jgi:hypothetical protein
VEDEKRVLEASQVAPLIGHPPDGRSTPRIQSDGEAAATIPDGSFDSRTSAACSSIIVRLFRARVLIRAFTELGKSSTALKALITDMAMLRLNGMLFV